MSFPPISKLRTLALLVLAVILISSTAAVAGLVITNDDTFAPAMIDSNKDNQPVIKLTCYESTPSVTDIMSQLKVVIVGTGAFEVDTIGIKTWWSPNPTFDTLSAIRFGTEKIIPINDSSTCVFNGTQEFNETPTYIFITISTDPVSSLSTIRSGMMSDAITLSQGTIQSFSGFFTQWIHLPVELVAFSAQASDRAVDLSWRVESEIENDHFNLYRSLTPGQYGSRIASVPGRGTTALPMTYRWRDAPVTNGVTYYYHLSDVSVDGIERFARVQVQATPQANTYTSLPGKFSLAQNFPNPFNGTTVIRFSVPVAGKVTLAIYDLSGRQILSVINTNMSSGSFSVPVDLSAHPSGVYYYRLQSNSYSTRNKLVLLK